MCASATDVATFRFTGEDLRQPKVMAVWREVVGRAMAKLDLSALPDRPLHSEAVVRMLPGLDIAASVSSGMRMERTRNLLADGDDDVALMICTQGAAMMSQRAREATLARGDAVLMTNGELGQITYPSLARMICVRMPREALAPMVPDLDDALLRPIRRDGEALRLLTSYSHGLLANALTRPDLRHLAATHMRDLVARTLGASGEAASSGEVAGIGAARLQAIKAEIMRRLGRHDLSVAAVAVSQGVGPRYSSFCSRSRARRSRHSCSAGASPGRIDYWPIRAASGAPSAPSRSRSASAICPTSIAPFVDATERPLRTSGPRRSAAGAYRRRDRKEAEGVEDYAPAVDHAAPSSDTWEWRVTSVRGPCFLPGRVQWAGICDNRLRSRRAPVS
ncbi:AraC-binding-like domain-containing protein [Rhizobiales bacterium GAS113]|nr:AraC-binding-like domain-containing protein [Rhizobiales bacterium GAS113]